MWDVIWITWISGLYNYLYVLWGEKPVEFFGRVEKKVLIGCHFLSRLHLGQASWIKHARTLWNYKQYKLQGKLLSLIQCCLAYFDSFDAQFPADIIPQTSSKLFEDSWKSPRKTETFFLKSVTSFANFLRQRSSKSNFCVRTKIAQVVE